jgi:hypothetical protein
VHVCNQISMHVFAVLQLPPSVNGYPNAIAELHNVARIITRHRWEFELSGLVVMILPARVVLTSETPA